MLEWVDTWQVALVAVLVLVVPGLGPALALGLRGLVAWGSAPLLGAGIIGGTAVVLGSLGIGWSVVGVLVVSAALTLVAALVNRATGRRTSPRTGPGRRRQAVALAVTVTSVLATTLQARRTLGAIGGPERVAQTFDTPYHLNAVKLMLETGDASSLHMTLSQPAAETAFYPGLWHGVVSLVVQLSGGDVAVAANWVTVVATTVVWPLGMLALARLLFGPRPLLLGLVVPFSFAMTQFPNRLMSFGLLYPNILAYSLLPAALALCVLGLLLTRGRGRVPSLLGLLLGTVGLALAQPNGLFALAYAVVPLVVLALWVTSSRRMRAGTVWWRAVLPWVATAFAGLGAIWALERLPFVSDFQGKVMWAVTSSWQHAVREAVGLSAMHPASSPNFPEPENLAGGIPNWTVAVIVAVGAIASLWVRRWRWLPFSYGIFLGLYVLVRGLDIPLRGALTGYWYADPQRLAALIPLIGVPLAVIGAATVVRIVLAPISSGRSRSLSPYVAALLAILVGAAISILLPRTATFKASFAYVEHVYSVAPDSKDSAALIDADELWLIGRLDEIVPEGVAVAGDPWDGSSMVWALADRRALYPHMGVVMDPDRYVVAEKLNEALTDPQVCEAVNDLDVGFVLRMGRHLWDAGQGGYPGFDGLVEAGVAELVAERGDARLYRITACG